MLAQQSDGFGRQRNAAPTEPRLLLAEYPTLPADPLGRLLDMGDAGVEVNVLPSKAQQLAAPHASHDREVVRHAVRGYLYASDSSIVPGLLNP